MATIVSNPSAAAARDAITPGPTPSGGGDWDVVVVGTGLGGATLGYALARAGHSVLFLEKGHADVLRDAVGADQLENPVARMAAAHWPDRMAARIDGRGSTPFPALGCGAGGSSLLYAAALERFARDDVESLPGQSHPTGGWPIAWAEMCRYYATAERLYRVAGTPDPLASGEGEALLQPPAASEADRQLMDLFRRAGLNPYRLHVGLGYKPGCVECGGRVCPNRCKSDAALICLEPAIRRHGAMLLSDSEVVSIEADHRRATGVVYTCRGASHRVRGRFVVLAAGAYRTPALLLRSRSLEWPDGLANGSDQVGRNLMFHANEWFAVWLRHRASTAGPRKTIGLRDLYRRDGMRLGSIQSTGLSAHAGNILTFLTGWCETRMPSWARTARPLLWVVSRVAQRVFGAATIFVMIVEDLGYPDNRVVLDPADPSRIVVEYEVREELRARASAARRLIRSTLRGLRVMPLQADVQLNLGHACGTCRAGDDPSSSVIDGSCKAHELDNLYIADASFMPTSGGTNPGLTIIANALRVADRIGKRLEAGIGVAARGATVGS